MTKIRSGFAVLDVTTGRRKLNKSFESNPRQRIPVVIHGYIDGIYGDDDGISREFNVRVTKFKTSNG